MIVMAKEIVKCLWILQLLKKHFLASYRRPYGDFAKLIIFVAHCKVNLIIFCIYLRLNSFKFKIIRLPPEHLYRIKMRKIYSSSVSVDVSTHSIMIQCINFDINKCRFFFIKMNWLWNMLLHGNVGSFH